MLHKSVAQVTHAWLSDQQKADLLAAELMTTAREHLAGRKPAVRNMAGDAQQQAKWLNKQAAQRGYENADAMALADFDAFEGLAAQWRGRNPASAMLARSQDTRAKFEARIDSLFAGGKPALNGVRALDRSDVVAMLGLGDGPVHLAEGKVNAAKHRNMTASVWKKIPDWMDHPAAVFDSDTVKGRLVMVAPETLNDAPVLIVIEPMGQTRSDGVRVHLLQNAYDKDESLPPFGRWFRDGLGRYVDQKKFPAILNASGLQLSGTAWQNKPGTGKILTEKNLAGYIKANPPLLSRAAAMPSAAGGAQNLTPAERAQELIQKSARTAQPLDAVAQAITRATGVEWAAKKVGGVIAGALNRYTPESVKAGLVSDYGLDPRVRDERVLMQARQQVQLRKAGQMIDSLASLTREESAAAYRWMNETDPTATIRGMDELPEGLAGLYAVRLRQRIADAPLLSHRSSRLTIRSQATR